MNDPIISTTGGVQAAAGSIATRPESAQKNEGISSDFETFLKMMTVQVQNQDPLNPIDATDYATQLATFSTVEQQVKTNDLLTEMTGLLGGDSLQRVSSWIGMEALVQAPVWFDQQKPLAIRPDVASDADGAVLAVRDAAGTMIQRFALEPGQDTVLWTGRDDSGALLPAGSYRFETESYVGDQLIDTRLSAGYDEVREVRMDGTDILVQMAGGSELPASLISGLRAADGV